jgi:hypothetical protein
MKVLNTDEYFAKYFKTKNTFRPIVLDYLFRSITFINQNHKIRALTNYEYTQISEAINIPIILVRRFITRFLVDLIRIRKFFKENSRLLRSKYQNRKVRIYLHKFHRLAPIFDYKRAMVNARQLQKKLKQLYFRPQIMTQIAVVIFITDLLDKKPSRVFCKIIQSNLRTLCNCSAYAFHRTRNRIGLTADIIKNLTKN